MGVTYHTSSRLKRSTGAYSTNLFIPLQHNQRSRSTWALLKAESDFGSVKLVEIRHSVVGFSVDLTPAPITQSRVVFVAIRSSAYRHESIDNNVESGVTTAIDLILLKGIALCSKIKRK